MRGRADVFVVGGGPAGLAAAIAARQRGFDVTVADGAKPPVDKACGEGLMPDTLSALQDLGAKLSASDGFPFRGIRFLEGAASAEADFPRTQGIGVRRVVLHQMLVETAQSVGVRFMWQTPVVGVRDHLVLTRDGEFHTQWIVGADGMRSRVRRWCGLEDGRDGAMRYANRRHYRIAPWSDHIEVYWADGVQAYVTPVEKNSVCVVLLSRRPELRLTSLKEHFPILAERLKDAPCIGSDRGGVTMTRQLKGVYRGAIALVGDASGSVDAITGDGLSLSFREAPALAAAMQSGDLNAYQRAHRELARRPTRMARLLALLDTHTRLRARTIGAFAAHPETFSRVLSVHVGAASSMEIASAGTLLGWRLVTA
jgi:flavin-dependent dehydrogenase